MFRTSNRRNLFVESLILTLPLFISAAGCENGRFDSTCHDGACEPACAEVICNAPPPPECVDTNQLRTFTDGNCQLGDCVYDESLQSCASGCLDGQCVGDPCSAITCDEPPVRSCVGGVLTRYSSPGTCAAGICGYSSSSETCPEGCSADGLSCETISNPGAVRDPSPLTIKQIHSGHSLTDSAAFQGDWPGHLQAMINDIQPGAAQVGKSTIPGSPLSWRWDNVPGYGSPDARSDIADWEVLVITEAVPLSVWLESPEWLRTWVEHAWQNGDGGNGAPTLLYTTWSNIDDTDGDFRSTLDAYEPQWEAMADYAAANLSEAATVYIVPGHRLMMGLYDDIQAGNVPGVTDISAFFSDTIHLNGVGSYAIALLHLAVLHHVDPRGLPHTGYGLSPEPSADLAAYLQEKVWNVATGYQRTGFVVDGQ